MEGIENFLEYLSIPAYALGGIVYAAVMWEGLIGRIPFYTETQPKRRGRHRACSGAGASKVHKVIRAQTMSRKRQPSHSMGPITAAIVAALCLAASAATAQSTGLR